MPFPDHEAYRTQTQAWFRSHAHEPDVPAQLERYDHAAVVLWGLDLEPARPFLAGCYAPNPRGGKPWDPILLLRCLLLMLLVVQPSKNKWIRDLAGNRVLRILAGLREGEWPGVGTLYDFLHRLHDGPIRGGCAHIERPSETERRSSRSARPPQRLEKAAAETEKKAAAEALKTEAKKKAAPPPSKDSTPKKGKGGRRARKQRKRDQAAVEAPADHGSVTADLVSELAKAASQANPNDLLARLAAILFAVGIQPSAARGLLGPVDKLTVSGDGSPLVTGASRYGKKKCDHPRHERCDCDRIYADPDARFGYDSHRDLTFFGHHFYEISVSVAGHDLPLAIRLDPGNTTDYTASVKTLDRLRKDLAGAGMGIRHFIADAGHDSEANHRYCLDAGILALIPMRGKAPGIHPTRPDMTLSKRGIPTCEAGAEMVPRGTAGADRPIFACPVRNGKLAHCPLAPPEQADWLCRPDLKHGPTVVPKVADAPRLTPSVPRNSTTYTRLYKLRSGCERSNSVKKEVFKLEDARHRRASFWLVRLHLIAVLQHARAWVGAGDARRLVDQLLGREADAKTA